MFRRRMDDRRILMLVSLLLAVMVWLWVNLSSPKRITRSFYVPVELYNAPKGEDGCPVEMSADEVEVVIKGRRVDLAKDYDKIRVWIDASNLPGVDGGKEVELNCFIPSSLVLVRINPPRVLVRPRKKRGTSSG